MISRTIGDEGFSVFGAGPRSPDRSGSATSIWTLLLLGGFHLRAKKIKLIN